MLLRLELLLQLRDVSLGGLGQRSARLLAHMAWLLHANDFVNFLLAVVHVLLFTISHIVGLASKIGLVCLFDSGLLRSEFVSDVACESAMNMVELAQTLSRNHTDVV